MNTSSLSSSFCGLSGSALNEWLDNNDHPFTFISELGVLKVQEDRDLCIEQQSKRNKRLRFKGY